MAKQRCEFCGRFMKLTDLMPQDDAFDEELARECGLTDEELFDTHNPDGKWGRFHYVQDQWECDNCQVTQWHEQGKKYYWNSASGNYDGQKPLTPKERAAAERARQEAAGQQRMFD